MEVRRAGDRDERRHARGAELAQTLADVLPVRGAAYERKGDGVDAHRVDGRPVFCYAQDPSYLGGSLGEQHADSIVKVLRLAGRAGAPVVGFIESGGARMQEGLLSLLQMAKTTAMIARLADAKLPFISVLADPTMGGVSASFAFMGDVVMAEPKALIGFAGPRTIKNTVRLELPEGFQTSEFFLQHGFIDRIVPRTHLRTEVARIIDFCEH